MLKRTSTLLQWCLLLSAVAASTSRSYDLCCNYQTNFRQVVDEISVDKDLRVMNKLMQRRDTFLAARNVYLEGGHSQPYAELTLPATSTTTSELSRIGTIVVGSPENSEALIQGTIVKGKQGMLCVQYEIGEGASMDCRVGGLPAKEQDLTGCFASAGTLVVKSVVDDDSENEGDDDEDDKDDKRKNMQEDESSSLSIDYIYDPLSDNKNILSLQNLGIATVYDDVGVHPVSPVMLRHAQEFSHEWILAALEGRPTKANHYRSSTDFTQESILFRAESVRLGTILMLVWTHVLQELQEAIYQCQEGCPECLEEGIRHWDTGVGFYTGSQGSSGRNGEFMYALALEECGSFGGCYRDDNGDVQSSLNQDLMQAFRVGQANLQEGRCEQASAQLDRVESFLVVPLLQGTLRLVQDLVGNKSNNNNNDDLIRAQAQSYSAALFPVLHSCDPQDAAVVHSIMKMDSIDEASETAVVAALERNFECLGLMSSDMILLNHDDALTDMLRKSNIPEIVGGVALALFGVVILVGPFLSINLRCTLFSKSKDGQKGRKKRENLESTMRTQASMDAKEKGVRTSLEKDLQRLEATLPRGRRYETLSPIPQGTEGTGSDDGNLSGYQFNDDETVGPSGTGSFLDLMMGGTKTGYNLYSAHSSRSSSPTQQ